MLFTARKGDQLGDFHTTGAARFVYLMHLPVLIFLAFERARFVQKGLGLIKNAKSHLRMRWKRKAKGSSLEVDREKTSAKRKRSVEL